MRIEKRLLSLILVGMLVLVFGCKKENKPLVEKVKSREQAEKSIKEVERLEKDMRQVQELERIEKESEKITGLQEPTKPLTEK